MCTWIKGWPATYHPPTPAFLPFEILGFLLWRNYFIYFWGYLLEGCYEVLANYFICLLSGLSTWRVLWSLGKLLYLSTFRVIYLKGIKKPGKTTLSIYFKGYLLEGYYEAWANYFICLLSGLSTWRVLWGLGKLLYLSTFRVIYLKSIKKPGKTTSSIYFKGYLLEEYYESWANYFIYLLSVLSMYLKSITSMGKLLYLFTFRVIYLKSIMKPGQTTLSSSWMPISMINH